MSAHIREQEEKDSKETIMRTRIYNARILTMEENRKIFTGEIRIEDGRIIDVRSVGKNEEKDVSEATGGMKRSMPAAI